MDLPRITAGKNGALLWVRVQPRAKREGIEGLHGDRLKIALNAPPVDGAANSALVRFLADLLEVPPSSLEVVIGQSNREKAVEIRGLTLEAAAARLKTRLESVAR